MSNAASSRAREAFMRFTLSIFLCLLLDGLASARSSNEAPRFFSIAALLGQANQPLEIFDRSSPFKMIGYQLFSADLHYNAAKWRKVETEIARDLAIIETCAETPRECSPQARFAASIIANARHLTSVDKASYINAKVNMSIRYQSDLDQFGIDDLWSSPLMVLGAKGDCEDYAIAKYALMKAAGVAEANMRLLLVNDTRVREDHALLSVDLNGSWTLFDNRTNKAESERDITDYRPLMSLTEHKAELYAAPLALTMSGLSAER